MVRCGATGALTPVGPPGKFVPKSLGLMMLTLSSSSINDLAMTCPVAGAVNAAARKTADSCLARLLYLTSRPLLVINLLGTTMDRD
jgi:hypothetical protein